MVETATALRKEVDRLTPLETLTGDLQRECSRLHDTSDMCALICLPPDNEEPSMPELRSSLWTDGTPDTMMHPAQYIET